MIQITLKFAIFCELLTIYANFRCLNFIFEILRMTHKLKLNLLNFYLNYTSKYYFSKRILHCKHRLWKVLKYIYSLNWYAKIKKTWVSHFLLNLYFNKGPSHLYSSIHTTNFQIERILITNKCSKFRFIIINIETILIHFYTSMIPRHWYICYSDLTFMTSTKFYTLWSWITDQHYTLCLLTCCF